MAAGFNHAHLAQLLYQLCNGEGIPCLGRATALALLLAPQHNASALLLPCHVILTRLLLQPKGFLVSFIHSIRVLEMLSRPSYLTSWSNQLSPTTWALYYPNPSVLSREDSHEQQMCICSNYVCSSSGANITTKQQCTRTCVQDLLSSRCPVAVWLPMSMLGLVAQQRGQGVLTHGACSVMHDLTGHRL